MDPLDPPSLLCSRRLIRATVTVIEKAGNETGIVRTATATAVIVTEIGTIGMSGIVMSALSLGRSRLLLPCLRPLLRLLVLVLVLVLDWVALVLVGWARVCSWAGAGARAAPLVQVGKCPVCLCMRRLVSGRRGIGIGSGSAGESANASANANGRGTVRSGSRSRSHRHRQRPRRRALRSRTIIHTSTRRSTSTISTRTFIRMCRPLRVRAKARVRARRRRNRP